MWSKVLEERFPARSAERSLAVVHLLFCVPESSKALRRENAEIVAVTVEAIRSHHLHRRTIQSNWKHHDDQDGSNGAKVVQSNKTLSCQEMITRINYRPEAS